MLSANALGLRPNGSLTQVAGTLMSGAAKTNMASAVTMEAIRESLPVIFQ